MTLLLIALYLPISPLSQRATVQKSTSNDVPVGGISLPSGPVDASCAHIVTVSSDITCASGAGLTWPIHAREKPAEMRRQPYEQDGKGLDRQTVRRQR